LPTRCGAFLVARNDRRRELSDFARAVIAWQASHGRHDLPWQGTRDPYRIWLSEIMLQQTQVATVIPYFLRFVETFPDVKALAAADEDEVLRLWSGLGYYSRARNLHQAARIVVERHDGAFPRGRAEIEALPGIGRSTAAAIAGFAFGARAAILDGNVKRVLARQFAVAGFPGDRAVELELWQLAESLLPAEGIQSYIQGLMDLGATVCTTRSPGCARCPVRGTCRAFAEDRVDALPAPRPRKTVPQRSTGMLILLKDGEVLLQKRPPVGIWGGLWSLPEIDVQADVRRVALAQYGCTVAGIELLGVLKHAFTHFALDITPIVARVAEIAPRAAQPGVMWVPLAAAATAAVPTPVRKLVLAVGASAGGGQSALFEVAQQDLEP
jgi:A/G-specific adenine glycosylase